MFNEIRDKRSQKITLTDDHGIVNRLKEPIALLFQLIKWL